MNAQEKKFIRSIIRQVHPDLFVLHPVERQKNSDSLKALNAFVEGLARGAVPTSTTLEFWVKDSDDGSLHKVSALLPASGFLGELFHAFGLITKEQLESEAARSQAADINFLQWLRNTVQEAVFVGQQHDDLKQRIRERKTEIEHHYGLASLVVEPEYAMRVEDQKRQLEALTILDTCLASLESEQRAAYGGLCINIYHPEVSPIGSYGFVQDDGTYNYRTSRISSFVAEDGTLHLVANRASLASALCELDTEKARLLSQVKQYWLRRVNDLKPVLKKLLKVQNVWCDTKTEQSSQSFVLWAGHLLENRPALQQATEAKDFSFSLLVHSDTSSPMIDFQPSSSMLQVRADCPMEQLTEFLSSEVAVAADRAAAALEVTRREEQELLEQIRVAFGAKSVVRVCSLYDRSKVLAGAQKLLEHAEVIKSSVSLSGASIAIDDCYEVWGSGFISIPYNFTLQELPAQLVRLLRAGEQRDEHEAASAAGIVLDGLVNGVRPERPSSSAREVVASAAAAGRLRTGAAGSRGLRHALRQQLPGLSLSTSATRQCGRAGFQPGLFRVML